MLPRLPRTTSACVEGKALMSMKRDIAERCVTTIAAVLRDSTLSREDRAQQIQDIIERALEEYGAAAAQRAYVQLRRV
jgi:hypothetical protein